MGRSTPLRCAALEAPRAPCRDPDQARAERQKFFNHFSQAALFYNSQSDPEKAHILQALRFELGPSTQHAHSQEIRRTGRRHENGGGQGCCPKQLAAVTASCVTCHDTYRLDEARE